MRLSGDPRGYFVSETKTKPEDGSPDATDRQAQRKGLARIGETQGNAHHAEDKEKLDKIKRVFGKRNP